MLIINKYKLSAETPVAATNNANAATGITSELWGGINPALNTGATGNAVAGNGLSYTNAAATYEDQVISKLVSITIPVLEVGVDNFIKVDLSTLGINGSFVVKGFCTYGIFDPNATNTGNTPTPSLTHQAGLINIVKDALIIFIEAAKIDLYENKTVNVLLLYTNS